MANTSLRLLHPLAQTRTIRRIPIRPKILPQNPQIRLQNHRAKRHRTPIPNHPIRRRIPQKPPRKNQNQRRKSRKHTIHTKPLHHHRQTPQPHIRNPNPKSRTHTKTLERKNQRLRKNLQPSRPNSKRNPTTQKPPKTISLHRPTIRHTPNPRTKTTRKQKPHRRRPRTHYSAAKTNVPRMANPTNHKKNHRTRSPQIPQKIHQTTRIKPNRPRTTLPKNNGKRENLWINRSNTP